MQLIENNFVYILEILYKYDRICKDRMWSQGAARNSFLTPDEATMEFIRRMQTRLIPKPEQFSTGFKYLNERERLK